MDQLTNTLHWMFVTNPIASNVGKVTKSTMNAIMPAKKEVLERIVHDKIPLWALSREAGPFVRIAGLMGASAVVLGAYGAHRQYPKEDGADLQRVFETGNRYHFFNTLALFGVPLCRYPRLSGSFLITGILLFSGACYYHAITGKNKFGKFAPIGGTCLIIGWLAMVL